MTRHAQSGAAAEHVQISVNSATELQDAASLLCQTCGACCSFSREWPRFALESDAALVRIPSALVADAQGCILCAGERCSALIGRVGVATSCAVYAERPEVCRVCVPGDDACNVARR